MSRAVRILLPLAIVGAGGAAAAAMILLRSRPAREVLATPPRLVRAVEARPGPHVYTVRAYGIVSARTESTVASEVAGSVVWVSPDLVAGAVCEAGQVLARIEPLPYRVALAEAESNAAEARLDLIREEAEAEAARREWDAAEGEPGPLAAREPQMLAARARLSAAEARVSRARHDLEKTAVRAPFTGRVRAKRTDLGQFVSPGAAVAVLYATDRMEVRLPLTFEQLGFLPPLPAAEAGPPRAGVLLRTPPPGPERSWTGRIVRTEAAVDPDTHTLHVVCEIDPPEGGASLLPPAGTFVSADIEGRRVEGVTLLPRVALRDGNRVYIVDAEERLRFRPVEVLRLEGERVVIGSGLSPGERVCVSPLAIAVDGQIVRVHDLHEDGNGR